MKRVFRKWKFIFPMLMMSVVAVSCFEDDEDIEPDYCSGIQSKVNEVTRQQEKFAANPTRSNCNSVKTSVLSMLEEVKKCPGQSKYATEAISYWKQLDCTDFK